MVLTRFSRIHTSSLLYLVLVLVPYEVSLPTSESTHWPQFEGGCPTYFKKYLHQSWPWIWY